MSVDVLSERALNRALLARQHLLTRSVADDGDRAWQVVRLVEHLVGLQAQAPFSPYYGLWSRLEGFRPAGLAELITGRRVVRIALMRGTIHLVSAPDCLLLRPLLQPVLDQGLARAFGKQLAGLDLVALAAAGRALVEEKPRTFSELGQLLSSSWPAHPPAALAQGVRALVPLVQVPPRAVWGAGGRAQHTSAQAWLRRPLRDAPSAGQLIERYLAAFGPASVQDVQAWSGLTRLREIAEQLRPRLRTFRDSRGTELFDLPDAARPSQDTAVPVRLVAEFDNLILSHADRSRIVSDASRKRLFSRNGIVPGTVLVDGFVAGTWRITQAGGSATLIIEPFRPLNPADRAEAEREGQRLLSFAAPDAEQRDIQIAALDPDAQQRA